MFGRKKTRNSRLGASSCMVLAVLALACAASAAQAGPVINDIGGATDTSAGITNGRVDMSLGTLYNGNLVVNDEVGVYTWTLKGSGFGTQTGTVSLAGRTAPILAWTDTAIKVNVSGAQINPARPWDWGGMCTTLRVRTAAGQTGDMGVNIVPAVKTRIYGQCTYWVAYRRKQMGKEPSPSAFGGYTDITSTWVPAKGDQLQWTVGSGKHAAIIESVQGPTSSNGVTTYSVKISQLNAACKNEYSEVTSDFRFSGSTVLKKPVFNTGGSNQGTSYYR